MIGSTTRDGRRTTSSAASASVIEWATVKQVMTVAASRKLAQTSSRAARNRRWSQPVRMCSTPSWKNETPAGCEVEAVASAGRVVADAGTSTKAVNWSFVSVAQVTTRTAPLALASCTHVTCRWPGVSFVTRLENTWSDRTGSPSGDGYSSSRRIVWASADARTVEWLTTL